MNMKQPINQSYFALHGALYRLVGEKEDKIEKTKFKKWESSHVFLLEKVGGAVFKGSAVFR